jgi:hypothetical protein
MRLIASHTQSNDPYAQLWRERRFQNDPVGLAREEQQHRQADFWQQTFVMYDANKQITKTAELTRRLE